MQLFGCGDGWLSARLATIRMLKNPRVRTEADNLFGCYGTSVSTYKGVWRKPRTRCYFYNKTQPPRACRWHTPYRVFDIAYIGKPFHACLKRLGLPVFRYLSDSEIRPAWCDANRDRHSNRRSGIHARLLLGCGLCRALMPDLPSFVFPPQSIHHPFTFPFELPF